MADGPMLASALMVTLKITFFAFLLSVLLLAISVWIRLSLNESPAFKKMKEEGKTSKAPLTESFAQWKNLKIVILALVGLTAGQAVVWYTGQFQALFFLQNTLTVQTHEHPNEVGKMPGSDGTAGSRRMSSVVAAHAYLSA